MKKNVRFQCMKVGFKSILDAYASNFVKILDFVENFEILNLKNRLSGNVSDLWQHSYLVQK